MLFNFTVSTPANTLESSKLKTTLEITYGVIHLIELQFPPGPSGYLHVHLNDALHQVAPYNTDENFASDNLNISFREFIPFLKPPFELSAYTWNLDDTFDHVVLIRIGILPPSVIAPWLQSYADRMLAAMGL